MTNKPVFWIVLMTGCSLIYLAALASAYQGQMQHPVVWLAIILLVAHVLEIPVAFKKLKGRNPAPLRLVVATILFGLLWWVPASRGVFAAR